jgi:hypothetical protein
LDSFDLLLGVWLGVWGVVSTNSAFGGVTEPQSFGEAGIGRPGFEGDCLGDLVLEGAMATYGQVRRWILKK